jgi:23S rRNA (cytidine1920-2'-O)/16S rRNA (cytidine1409-2'-O)-methyltransferase
MPARSPRSRASPSTRAPRSTRRAPPAPERRPALARSRLDQLLLERGLADSRAKAQALILAGQVFADQQRLDKPGQLVPADLSLEVRGRGSPYVSRGGIKLAHGLERFGLEPAGLVALDIGASSGGFTDVLLQRGAARVHAVDVGHGQLDWRLRNDPRVVVLERTNARHLTPDLIAEPIDLVVCDASFISLKVVLPAGLRLTRPGAWLMALIKPQFEVGKGRVGKGGVVRDPALHAEVCDAIAGWLEAAGWRVHGTTPSPITGPKGNREFLICARRR